MSPGQEFVKEWVYRNGGEVEWPNDVVFMQTSGDMMGAVTIKITETVQPDAAYTWKVAMKAPEKAGRYTAYFRMQTGHSVRFGHKVWCDILVKEPTKAQIMSSIVMQEDNLAKSIELEPL